MKTLKFFLVALIMGSVIACSSSDNDYPTPDPDTDTDTGISAIHLEFKNYIRDDLIQLGEDTTAPDYTDSHGEILKFTELKYVISNVVLVTEDGKEVPYFTDDLDKGAQVVNLAKEESLNFLLDEIPSDVYSQLKFTLGVKPELNELDETSFPEFYAQAGENDTEMMWEWGNGYRFVKVEGFYGTDHKIMSIHTGSTVQNVDQGQVTNPDPDLEKEPGIDASRDIVLNLEQTADTTGDQPVTVIIKADFDKLFDAEIFVLNDKHAVIHTAAGVESIMNHIGGDGETDQTGMFSILEIN